MEFIITLNPSGTRFSCENGETILEAALRHGIKLNYGCRSGSCGTCLGKLLSGKVDYEEDYPALENLDAKRGDTLYCSAIPRSDLEIISTEINVREELPVKQTPAKVTLLEKLSHDVIQMNFKLPDAMRIQFLAGQYLDIMQANGERRSFSIANSPHKDEFIELHIRHVAGGEFTQYIFEQVKLKDIFRIELPLGTFFLRENSNRPIILMGGGTGFAPLKGIIEHAIHIGVTRPMHLFWGVRSKRDLYMPELPEQWCKDLEQFHFTPVLSQPLQTDGWDGETGFVHESVLRHYPDLSATQVYMSGPPVMINAARDAFLKHGMDVQHMFSDAFEYNAHPDAD